MSNRVDWMGQLIKQLTSYRQSIGFELLVFDSLGAFFTLTKMENPATKSSDCLRPSDVLS